MSNWLNDLINKLTEYQRILLICSPGFSKRGELKNVLNVFCFFLKRRHEVRSVQLTSPYWPPRFATMVRERSR